MAELRNINWSRLIKDLASKEARPALLKSKSLQWWLTIGLRKQGFVLLDDLEELVLEYNGIKFHPDLMNYPRIFEAWDRYKIGDIKPDDIVLDIGANIGSFTLPAAKICKRVVAVEPIFFESLRLNVKLNVLKNVELLNGAVTTQDVVDCQGHQAKVLQKYYIDPNSKFDVVRLDCGGEEWSFNPYVFRNTRQLEVEFHFFKDEHRKNNKWANWKNFLERNNYGYIARWSKHKHWLYLSANKERKTRLEVQLTNGSFRGQSRQLWNS